jgi:hypothetical protein
MKLEINFGNKAATALNINYGFEQNSSPSSLCWG